MQIKNLEVPIEIRALRTANVYLIDSNDKFIFDTGMSKNSYEYIKSNMDIDDVDYIIISHLHIDHLGGAMYFNKISNIPVYISKNDYNYIKNFIKDNDFYFNSYKELLKTGGVPEMLINEILNSHPLIKFINYYNELNIKILDFTPNNFEVIDVPGHSPGSIVLYSKSEKLLFSGDHILNRITPNISVYSKDKDYLGLYINSLEKIKNIDVQTVYPGHGEIFHNYQERINEILKHHNNRIETILKILKSWKSPYEVASEIEWSKGRKMETMNYMEKNFAIMETMAHLIYMHNKDLIKISINSGVNKYIV